MERGSKSRPSGEQKVAQYATMVHSYSHVADEPEMLLLKKCMSEAGQVRIPTIDWPEMLLLKKCMSEAGQVRIPTIDWPEMLLLKKCMGGDKILIPT
jgi:hypothetical protein